MRSLARAAPKNCGIYGSYPMKNTAISDAKQDVAAALVAVSSGGNSQGAPAKWSASTHYTYLAVFEDRGLAFIKVGLSDNPDRRLGEIGVGCPFVLNDLFICQTPSREKAFGLEQTILRRYSSLSTKGEWLRMEADKVRPWVAGLSVIAMTRFGQDSMFKPHTPRKKFTPGFKGGKMVRSGAN